MTDHRLALLRAALGFLAVRPAEPELQLLHRWLDTSSGIGVIAVGMHRQGLRLSLSQIADGEWEMLLHGRQRAAGAKGFGVAPTPWRAVQIAARGAMT